MTYREKLQKEHPWMNETITDVVVKERCPSDLDYECFRKCKHCSEEICINCWDREMPNEEEKEEEDMNNENEEQEIRNKAIDEFAEKLSREFIRTDEDGNMYIFAWITDFREIAEKMKRGK